MKRIATARIWNPDLTGRRDNPELAAMARLCRKGVEKPAPLRVSRLPARRLGPLARTRWRGREVLLGKSHAGVMFVNPLCAFVARLAGPSVRLRAAVKTGRKPKRKK